MKKALIVLFAILLLGVVILFTWPLFPVLLSDFWGWCGGLLGHEGFWIMVGIVAGLVMFLFLFVYWCLPFLVFVFRKIYIYISLRMLCFKRKYKFKSIGRSFFSFGRLSEKGDIKIETDEGSLYLHFLNIVFRSRCALTFPNEQEYVITPVIPGKVSKIGGAASGTHMGGQDTAVFATTEHIMLEKQDRLRPLPSISVCAGKTHILLVPGLPSEAKVMKKGEILTLGSGLQIGALTYFSFDTLMNGLKKQLHTSVFDIKADAD